jgi:ATP-dependent DNA helicase RecG
LELLKNKPSITRKELATLVGISSDGIKYHLEKMKSAGYIRHVGPTKAGFWEILK